MAIAVRSISTVPTAAPAVSPTPLPKNKLVVDQHNAQVVDSAAAQVQTGDVVLRMGMGADSYLLSQLNQKNKNYSHCGIVVIEDGRPYVYHAIGGEDNPDERLRREEAAAFFLPKYNSAIAIVRYDMKAAQKEKLAALAREYYKRRPRFDMKFDLATDDKLYCSEFVYKALRQATSDTSYIGTTEGMRGRYVAIDNLLLSKHAKPVLEIKFKQYLYSPNR